MAISSTQYRSKKHCRSVVMPQRHLDRIVQSLWHHLLDKPVTIMFGYGITLQRSHLLSQSVLESASDGSWKAFLSTRVYASKFWSELSSAQGKLVYYISRNGPEPMMLTFNQLCAVLRSSHSWLLIESDALMSNGKAPDHHALGKMLTRIPNFFWNNDEPASLCESRFEADKWRVELESTSVRKLVRHIPVEEGYPMLMNYGDYSSDAEEEDTNDDDNPFE